MYVCVKFEEKDDPIGEKFLRIKESLGVNNCTEVFRHIVKAYPLEKEALHG